jgi:hypothetical protein
MGLELAAALASEIPATDSSRWRLQSILDMKLREFIPPGKALELEVRVKQRETDSATLSLVVRSGREIAGSARVLLVPEVCE